MRGTLVDVLQNHLFGSRILAGVIQLLRQQVFGLGTVEGACVCGQYLQVVSGLLDSLLAQVGLGPVIQCFVPVFWRKLGLGQQRAGGLYDFYVVGYQCGTAQHTQQS